MKTINYLNSKDARGLVGSRESEEHLLLVFYLEDNHLS